MYSSNDLNEIIKEHVSKLDLQWFEKKEVEFKQNIKYSIHTESIHIVDKQGYPNYGDDGEILGYEEVIENHIFDFEKYCSCYLPICDATGWGSYRADFYDSKGRHIDKSDNIDEIAYDLVAEIGSFLKEEKDAITTHKFINSVLDKIEVEITLQKKNYISNEIYCSVLDDFLNRCTYQLYRKNEKNITIAKEIDGYSGKLEFDLSQNRLLALLYLIQGAEFLNYTDNKFLRFCADHFLYKDRKGNMKIPDLINFQKKYSNIGASISNGSEQYLSPRDLSFIKEKLTKVLSSIPPFRGK